MPAKGAKKRTKRRKPKKTRANKSKRGDTSLLKRTMLAMAFVVLLSLFGLVAIYSFGSMATRGQMEQAAIRTIGSLRGQNWLPSPVSRFADRVHDQLPGSEGYSIDAGELLREDSHFIAGQPRASQPVQLLRNRSYFNLYSPTNKQTVCVAMRLINKKAEAGSLKVPFIEDPRIKNVRPRDMKAGDWGAANVAPILTLTRQHGERAAQEASLHTNLAPMTEAFTETVWRSATELLAIRYPQRFEEIWLYIGPVFRPDQQKLPSGVSIPEAFYMIAFDFTEAGGLRALSLIIPTSATDTDLRSYITTIDQIEAKTGMIFLPAIEPHVRQPLIEWQNQVLW